MCKNKKIGFCDFYNGFDKNNNFITDALQIAQIDYEIVNVQEANYVFFSGFMFGENHWNIADESIKIFFTGENIVPDFNACDYAMGFEFLEYGDRYLRYPLYLTYSNICEQMESKHNCLPDNSLQREFCSFVVSNGNANKFRQQLFERLSQYKKVDSGGRYMNNVGGPVNDKIEFERKHKFSIACENSSHPGYTTEKLVQAFAAQTVPIYWGDPCVTNVFNPKAFINAGDYSSLDDLVEHIIKIDSNDELYMSILKQPALISEKDNKTKQLFILASFLKNIFNQPVTEAQRYNRDLLGRQYRERERWLRYLETEKKSLRQHAINELKKTLPFRILNKLNK